MVECSPGQAPPDCWLYSAQCPQWDAWLRSQSSPACREGKFHQELQKSLLLWSHWPKLSHPAARRAKKCSIQFHCTPGSKAIILLLWNRLWQRPNSIFSYVASSLCILVLLCFVFVFLQLLKNTKTILHLRGCAKQAVGPDRASGPSFSDPHYRQKDECLAWAIQDYKPPRGRALTVHLSHLSFVLRPWSRRFMFTTDESMNEWMNGKGY